MVPPHHQICSIFLLLWLWSMFVFFVLMFCKKLLVPFGNCLSSDMSSSPHIFFIRFFYTSNTLNYLLTLYVLIYYALSCVSPPAVIVAWVRGSQISDAYTWYNGIPDVFILSVGICWWFSGLCWGLVGVGTWYPTINMWCVGKIWVNPECAHGIASWGRIPKNYAWVKKGLTLLSLHFQIMQERRKVSAWDFMYNIYVLSVSLL